DVDNISDLEKEEAQEKDSDEGDIYDMWEITVEDIERIRKFLTPNILDIINDVTQPLIPKTIHTTPPDEDYVAPATKSILDELLEEFRDEILNLTMVSEEADFNHTKDIEEFARILAKDPRSHFTEIEVHLVIIKPKPFIHTQSMSPLYGAFKSSKSSNNPYKVDRETTSPWYDFYSSIPYPVAYFHPNGVDCYFHPHLIPNLCTFQAYDRTRAMRVQLSDHPENETVRQCEIDHATDGKLRNNNADESWEIIKNLVLYDHEGPNPQPQALGTTFEARVRDYMAAHTERMENFENSIFKQCEEINGRMTEIEEEEKNDIYDVATGNDNKETEGPNMEVSVKKAETNNGAENGAKNKPIKKPEKEEVVEAPSSWPVEYYLKHRINEKLIEGLVDNNRFNDSLSGARAGKKKGKTYNVLPRGHVYEAILKKKITKKDDIGGNFEIPCSIGGLKHVNALVDQGSDVNVMPYSTYMKLTDERPVEKEIRLSLVSHSYSYPLGIAGDVLVEIAEHVYPMDFVILDIKEDENRHFILGTPFLTTAKVVIKFDKGTITLRSGKSKIGFYRIHESPSTIERGVKNNIEPIAPTMTVNRLVLEWKERIRLHQEREIEFDRWRSKNFKNEHPALTKVKGEMDNEGEVT
ncbi:zinc finger, CCHC-type containing protein, partial [Tanacetum coccineum]